MPKADPREAMEQFRRALEECGPNIVATLTADGEIEAIHDFFPQFSARLVDPDLHDAFEWARCLTDDEMLALPPPKPFSWLKD